MSYIKNAILKLVDATGRTRLAPYITRVILHSGKKFGSALEKQIYLQLLMASVSMSNMPSLEDLGALSGDENVEAVSIALGNLVKGGALTLLDKPFNEKRDAEKIYIINDIFSG